MGILGMHIATFQWIECCPTMSIQNILWGWKGDEERRSVERNMKALEVA